jgi:hypothetical protein
MDGGSADEEGMRRSSEASTAMRSSSKKIGRFIVTGGWRKRRETPGSRFALAFRVEGLGGNFAVGFFEEDFDAAFGLFELLLALAGKSDAFFEELHGIVERELGRLEAADDFLEASEGTLEIGLLGRFGLFGGR